MTERVMKDPEKTSFNVKYGDVSPKEFQAYFEANFFGDWKKYYKKLGGKVPVKRQPAADPGTE